jgi:hypothetical protein
VASIRTGSEITTPSGTLGGGGGGGVAVKPLQQDWVPEYGRHPAVDAVNGPLTGDSGIVSGDLPGGEQTNMRFIPWDAVDNVTGQPIFNYQGMIPAVAPANIQTAAGRTCLLNAFTPRWFNGTTGQYYNGNQSIRVGIASQVVVPVWYCAQGQLSATSLDMHVMVEHQGQNKHLSSSSSTTNPDGLPRSLSGGSGTYRRKLTYSDHRYREHRFMLGGNGYFLGVWIDTLSVIRRPKNRPQLFVTGTDSWHDPQTWFSEGFTWPSGDYQCLPPCVVASFKTGMAWGTDAQGGTGEYNANGTTGGGDETYSGHRSSAAWSDSRVNWRADYWSKQFAIFTDVGGWNDGSSMTTPYQSTYRARVAARIQKTIDRCEAYGRETRFVNVGIQPVDISGPTDKKWLAALGQAELPGLFPGVVIGHVPLMPMWPDTTPSGPRDIYTTSDGIHLNAGGDDAVTGYYVDGMGEFNIDQAYLNLCANADVPLEAVPTS